MGLSGEPGQGQADGQDDPSHQRRGEDQGQRITVGLIGVDPHGAQQIERRVDTVEHRHLEHLERVDQ